MLTIKKSVLPIYAIIMTAFAVFIALNPVFNPDQRVARLEVKIGMLEREIAQLIAQPNEKPNNLMPQKDIINCEVDTLASVTTSGRPSAIADAEQNIPNFLTATELEIEHWYLAAAQKYKYRSTFSNTDKEAAPLLKLAKANAEMLLNLYLSYPEDGYLDIALYQAIYGHNAHLLEPHIASYPALTQLAVNVGLHDKNPQLFIDLLKNQLDSQVIYIPPALIEAAASDLKHTTYATALRQYAIKGLNKYYTFSALEAADYPELDSLADSLWNNLRRNNIDTGEWEEAMISYSAAKYGNKGALDNFVLLSATSLEDIAFVPLFRGLFSEVVTIEDYQQNKELFGFNLATKKWQAL